MVNDVDINSQNIPPDSLFQEAGYLSILPGMTIEMDS